MQTNQELNISIDQVFIPERKKFNLIQWLRYYREKKSKQDLCELLEFIEQRHGDIKTLIYNKEMLPGEAAKIICCFRKAQNLKIILKNEGEELYFALFSTSPGLIQKVNQYNLKCISGINKLLEFYAQMHSKNK